MNKDAYFIVRYFDYVLVLGEFNIVCVSVITIFGIWYLGLNKFIKEFREICVLLFNIVEFRGMMRIRKFESL